MHMWICLDEICKGAPLRIEGMVNREVSYFLQFTIVEKLRTAQSYQLEDLEI